MHEYDTTLKSLLTRPGGNFLGTLAGVAIGRWLNVELPEVRNLRVDLLGETTEGGLFHGEMQRANVPDMIWRMLEYALAIRKSDGRFPEQIVLYIGDAPLRMPNRLEIGPLVYECRMVDIRDFDAEPFLTSASLEDNIVGVLARLRDAREAVKRILERIAAAEPDRRSLAMKELTLLAGLRKLETVIKQEAAKMPILDDIMDHDLFGPAIRQGRMEGRDEGRVEGRLEGERIVLSSLIAARFGIVPPWAKQRLDRLSAPELEKIALRILDAKSLEELLG